MSEEKRGRPILPDNQRRTAILRLSFTEETMKMIRHAAAEENLDAKEWAEEILRLQASVAWDTSRRERKKEP